MPYHTYYTENFYIKIFIILTVIIFHKHSLILLHKYLKFHLSFYFSTAHQEQSANKGISEIYLFWRIPVKKYILLSIYITLSISYQTFQNEHFY